MELIEPTLTLRKIILLKTVKGFCCLMQEIKNGIDRTHLMSCFVFSFKKKIQRDVPEKYASNKGE